MFASDVEEPLNIVMERVWRVSNLESIRLSDTLRSHIQNTTPPKNTSRILSSQRYLYVSNHGFEGLGIWRQLSADRFELLQHLNHLDRPALCSPYTIAAKQKQCNSEREAPAPAQQRYRKLPVCEKRSEWACRNPNASRDRCTTSLSTPYLLKRPYPSMPTPKATHTPSAATHSSKAYGIALSIPLP